MAEEAYSPQVREHLEHPNNAGAMENPDAVGVQGNPICGDTMKLMLRIEGGQIVDARWQTVGCEPARATSSIVTDLVVGRPLAEVGQITKEEVLQATGGLPTSKMHASTMAAEALRRAVATYRSHHPE